VLVLNKVDRLVLELRLPPPDAYYRLRSLVDAANTVLAQHWAGRGPAPLFSPVKGNVLFASCLHGWVSLFSFLCVALRGMKRTFQRLLIADLKN
jgi:translation elongation factor EF-G